MNIHRNKEVEKEIYSNFSIEDRFSKTITIKIVFPNISINNYKKFKTENMELSF